MSNIAIVDKWIFNQRTVSYGQPSREICVLLVVGSFVRLRCLFVHTAQIFTFALCFIVFVGAVVVAVVVVAVIIVFSKMS